MSLRSRGLLAAALAAALSTSMSLVPGATAADPLPLKPPRAGCALANDDPADAKMDSGTAAGALPANTLRPHPGTEIENLTFNSTATELQAFLKVKNVPAATGTNEATPSDTMGVYDSYLFWRITFKIGSKEFKFSTYQANPSIKGPTAPSTESGPTGVPVPIKRWDVNKDTDYVALVLDRAEVEKVIGEELVVGETEMTVKAETQHYVLSKFFVADTMSDAAYVWGDDTCFAPPKAKLIDLTGHKAAVFSDAAKLSVTVTSADDEPVSGLEVTFTTMDKTLTATSDDDGLATVTLPVVDKPAGSYPLTVSFAGTDEHGKVEVTDTVVVKPDTARFAALAVQKVSATTRNVTATLKDDDGKVIPGARVNWWVNGKRVATSVGLDSAGRAIYRNAKAGQTIQAEFPGVANKYSSAKSTATRL